ncbi:MAG: serine protease, partial [Armatimonadia bacterium]
MEISIPGTFSHVRRLSVVGALVVCLVMAGGCSRSPRSANMDSSRLFELTKPGVLMVQTNFKAKVEVPTPDLNRDKVEELKETLAQKMADDEITQDEARVFMYNTVANNPTEYLLYTDPVRTVDVDFGFIGSGWVINPDGYVVTNAHVATPDEQEIKDEVARQALGTLLEDDMKTYLNYWADHIVAGLSSDQMELTKSALVAFYIDTMKVGQVNKTILAATGLAVPGLEVTQKGLPAEVAVAGEPIPGKDVAILKLENKNLQTLPVGDSSSLKTGDHIYVVGYPGVATFHPLLSESSQTEPTLTAGVISARKSMQGGWDVLQTDAASTHGSSGGPVLNEAGQVVGILTFGSTEPETGQEIQGMNFIVPMTVVNEFLAKQNIRPAASPLNGIYANALDLMDKGHYRAASARLQQLNAIAPGTPYVQEKMTFAQRSIAEGKDRGSGTL